MKRLSFAIFAILVAAVAFGQPTYTVSPPSFTAEDEITVTVDVTNTSLKDYAGNVWMWAWIAEGCSAGCDAPTNVNPASAAAAGALMTRSDANPNVYSITFVPSAFYNKPPSEIKKMGFKLKSIDWADGKQSDVDVVLNVEPLVFTPRVNRVFPSKVTKSDVLTLYLDQTLASAPALKYELSDFTVTIEAFNESGESVGMLEDLPSVNSGNGVHYIRILPTYNFNTEDIESINYTFHSTASDVSSEQFSLVFFK